ncbi:translation initiation factor IF-2 [Oryctolagus cuniculus]|uniref:translation initiation factor IF-2 n=1 Tax=Oryctolagus cuniculus TaxID=9986 RepID=UPI00387A7D8E
MNWEVECICALALATWKKAEPGAPFPSEAVIAPCDSRCTQQLSSPEHQPLKPPTLAASSPSTWLAGATHKLSGHLVCPKLRDQALFTPGRQSRALRPLCPRVYYHGHLGRFAKLRHKSFAGPSAPTRQPYRTVCPRILRLGGTRGGSPTGRPPPGESSPPFPFSAYGPALLQQAAPVGSDSLRHTHAHTAGHVSRRQLPARARRGPGGGRGSASRGERGARTAWHQRPEDAGREEPNPPGLLLFGADPEGAGCPRHCHRGRPRLSPSASRLGVALVPSWGKEDAHLHPQSGCGPRHCADSGSSGCPCRARAAGARPAAPGSSLSRKCRKRTLNSTTSRPPPPAPRPNPTAAAAACVWRARPPYSHARTHSRAHWLPFTPTRPSQSPSPGVRNYWANCRPDRGSRRVARSDPTPAAAPWAPDRAAAGDHDKEIAA